MRILNKLIPVEFATITNIHRSSGHPYEVRLDYDPKITGFFVRQLHSDDLSLALDAPLPPPVPSSRMRTPRTLTNQTHTDKTTGGSRQSSNGPRVDHVTSRSQSSPSVRNERHIRKIKTLTRSTKLGRLKAGDATSLPLPSFDHCTPCEEKSKLDNLIGKSLQSFKCDADLMSTSDNINYHYGIASKVIKILPEDKKKLPRWAILAEWHHSLTTTSFLSYEEVKELHKIAREQAKLVQKNDSTSAITHNDHAQIQEEFCDTTGLHHWHLLV